MTYELASLPRAQFASTQMTSLDSQVHQYKLDLIKEMAGPFSSLLKDFPFPLPVAFEAICSTLLQDSNVSPFFSAVEVREISELVLLLVLRLSNEMLNRMTPSHMAYRVLALIFMCDDPTHAAYLQFFELLESPKSVAFMVYDKLCAVDSATRVCAAVIRVVRSFTPSAISFRTSLEAGELGPQLGSSSASTLLSSAPTAAQLASLPLAGTDNPSNAPSAAACASVFVGDAPRSNASVSMIIDGAEPFQPSPTYSPNSSSAADVMAVDSSLPVQPSPVLLQSSVSDPSASS